MNRFTLSRLKEIANQNAMLALAEDLGEPDGKSGDLSADLIPPDSRSAAQIVCRENAVLCGIPWVNAIFAQLDTDIRLEWQCQDGEAVQSDSVICKLTGSTRSLLTGERSALNFLQTLSGTATTTRHYMNQLKQSKLRILDTRKTIPGLRYAQKYAVFCGGGNNHRFGLFDAMLLKENHIIAAGSIEKAIRLGRSQHPDVFLEVEVENLEELQQVLHCSADRVLLDNFSQDMITQAVKLVNGKIPIELSGNIDESTLATLNNSGIDYISIGALTKHLKAVDFSMRFASVQS